MRDVSSRQVAELYRPVLNFCLMTFSGSERLSKAITSNRSPVFFPQASSARAPHDTNCPAWRNGALVRPMSRPLGVRLHMLTRGFSGERVCEMVSSEDADVQGQACEL